MIQALLHKAAEGKISEPRQEMFDAGITSYQGYIHSSFFTKVVTLGTRGDVVIENSVPAAKALIDILDKACRKARESH